MSPRVFFEVCGYWVAVLLCPDTVLPLSRVMFDIQAVRLVPCHFAQLVVPHFALAELDAVRMLFLRVV